jgi:hypothetical protein
MNFIPQFGTTMIRPVSTAAWAISLSACMALPTAGADSWKEEVMLHDGQKIIVERSQAYGGRTEVGQPLPTREHTIRFTMPGSRTSLSWTSEYDDDIGRTNFNPLALHVMQGTPYLVVEPNLCLSYNKWGRPNPPYVFFKYGTDGWQRIGLANVPGEFKTINLIVNTGRLSEIREVSEKSGLVSAGAIRSINDSLRQPEYQTILREPLRLGRCQQFSSGPKAPNQLAPSNSKN